MTSPRPRTPLAILLATALASSVSTPASPETPPAWAIRLLVGSASAPDAHGGSSPSAFTESRIETGWSAAVQLERRFPSRVGVQLSWEEARFDAETTTYLATPPHGEYQLYSRATGRFGVQPLKLAVLFHRGEGGDLYGGPQVAWVRYHAGPLQEREGDAGVGVLVGMDYPARGRWALSVQGDFLSTVHEETDRDIYNDDQLFTLRAGVALRIH